MHRLVLLLLACVFAVVFAVGSAWSEAQPTTQATAPSPVCVLAFDGRAGTMIVDAQAISRLAPGDVIRTRYGAHTIALRIERTEHRRDHVYVAMAGVDQVDGASKRTSGAFHLHDDGTVTHFVNDAKVAFDVHGRTNARLMFANRRKTTHAP
jgi:hypothetical protein